MLVLRIGAGEAPRPLVTLLRYSPDSRAIGVASHRLYRTSRGYWAHEFKVWRCGPEGSVAEVRAARSQGWEYHRPPITFDELMAGTSRPVPRFTTPARPGRGRSPLMTVKAADGDTYAQLVQYYDVNFRAPRIYAVLVRPAGCRQTTTVAEWSSRTKGVRKFTLDRKITLDPSGRLVAALVGKVVHVWSVETGDELTELKFGPLRPEDMAFSADGRTFAVVVQDRVCFYEATSWKEAKVYSWKVGKLLTVAFSPDGTTAAVGSNAGEVVVFDLE